MIITDLDPTVMKEEVKKVLMEELGGKYSPHNTNLRISAKINKTGEKIAFVYDSGNKGKRVDK